MPDKRILRLASINWFLLSFLAGNVNAGGYLACARFVTHVTGFATLFGIDFANGDFDKAIGILSVPAFFLMGAMLSAYLIDRRFHRGHAPRYAFVMALVALCLVTAALVGHMKLFGEFGEPPRLKHDYFLLALLCMASGLQNAAITTSSGAAIRTTHLTGITTDLAIGLVRAGSLRDKADRYTREMRENWLRIGTIASFMVGSVVGVYTFQRSHYLGFLLPAAIAVYEFGIAVTHRDLFTHRYNWIRGDV